MKILLCAADAPIPPFSGLGRVVYNLAKGLAVDHDVRVVALGEPADAALGFPGRLVTPPPAGLVSNATAFLRAARTRRPLRAAPLARAIRPALTDELRRFEPDVVHLLSGRIALVHDVIDRPAVLTALDAWHLNVEAQAGISRGARRILLMAEAARVRRFEAEVWAKFARVVFVTDEDADAIRALAPGLEARVITIGVDIPRVVATEVVRNRIVFHGVLRYPPNVAACQRLVRRVLPLVTERVPDATVALVGREPSSEVVALGAAHGVDVVGEVADVVPWLAGSRAYACAVESGTGVKTKVLEAMAAGTPVVSTSRGLQGLDVDSGVEALCADDDAGLAEHLIAVLRDDDLAIRLRDSARRYVADHHQWSSVVQQYESLYQEVMV